MRRSELVAEILRWAFPRYVEERLSRELGTVDAELIEETPALPPLRYRSGVADAEVIDEGPEQSP